MCTLLRLPNKQQLQVETLCVCKRPLGEGVSLNSAAGRALLRVTCLRCYVLLSHLPHRGPMSLVVSGSEWSGEMGKYSGLWKNKLLGTDGGGRAF